LTDKLVTFRTFRNAFEAHLALSALEVAGIQAFIENEYSQPWTPHFAVKLTVRQSDLQRAEDALKTHV
jgi:hypothetical protein